MAGVVDPTRDGTCREVQAAVDAAELEEKRDKRLEEVGVVSGGGSGSENVMRLIVVVVAGSTMHDDGGVKIVVRRRDREVCEAADRRFVGVDPPGGDHRDDEPNANGQQSDW